jgi:hypothetical protein
MTTGNTTINVSKKLRQSLGELADKVAKKEGLSRVSLPQLLERLQKRYEDTEDFNTR